jgi:5-hydroxyisourate hydrolase
MISTQVIDTARGRPAAHIPVELDLFITGQGWYEVGRGFTNSEGMIGDFGEPAAAGLYRLMFDIASYSPDAFFPSISIAFEIRDFNDHFHVPLQLSPYGYSVYRGH